MADLMRLRDPVFFSLATGLVKGSGTEGALELVACSKRGSDTQSSWPK